jgi:hypothetical protein
MYIIFKASNSLKSFIKLTLLINLNLMPNSINIITHIIVMNIKLIMP